MLSTGPDLPAHAPTNSHTNLTATSCNTAPDPTQNLDNATMSTPQTLIDLEPITTPSTSSILNNMASQNNNPRPPRAAAKENGYINHNTADDRPGSSKNFIKKAGQAEGPKGLKRR
jgi:hypothetical protein